MGTRNLPVVSEGVYAKFNACVHCGLCLPACPTYVETGDEADSPRGRIHLMKAAVDGKLGGEQGLSEVVFEHLDRCLVCRACETACPSGVEYHALVEAVRPQVAEAVLGKEKRGRGRVLQWMVENVLPYSNRAAVAMAPLQVARKVGLGGVAGKVAKMMGVGAMAEVAGVVGDERVELPMFTPAKGEHRGNVVLLRGCVGSLVSGGVNAAAVRVISENGYDVHLLANEGCCGAMAMHSNDPEGGRRFGRELVEMLHAKGGDFFVSPIAGCGAQLKELGHLVGGEKAEGVAAKMRDITEFLAEIGIHPPTGRVERTVTYHDPCHLVHAQRISSQPRYLLGLVPGLKVVPLAESDLCCGAAGTYNLSQPEMAEKLGRRKVANVLATGAEELVTANVGCALQIARVLKNEGHAVRVRHVVELLAESYAEEGHHR
ncbi:MAG: (Fe-S)-binding protein [Phycisphaerae bacterium]